MPRPDAPPPAEWVTLDEAATRMGCSRRQAQRALADVDERLTRTAHPNGAAGRPQRQIHITALPRLAASSWRDYYDAPTPHRQSAVDDLAADDLATATLRAQAVSEYRARREHQTEAAAAAATCAEWIRARTRVLNIGERIGRHTRNRETTVRVGGFSAATLRRWDADYRAGGLAALAPARKNAAGRERIGIPEALINLIYCEAVRSPRADIAKAINKARRIWRGHWPDVSYSTIRRRVREYDPGGAGNALGKGGIAKFRQQCSPDIERDYSDLRLNELWEIDDVQSDFYCHSGLDPLRLIRPYVYAIIRCSTREWIAAVCSEEPITQAQVRGLIGLAMTDPRGGIPEMIRFERGTVALDDQMEELLAALNVRYTRTSMNSGRVAPGAMADRATGHSAGKGIVESNIRGQIHAATWDQPGQVGPEERHTAHARIETQKAASIAAIKAGKPLALPTMTQAVQAIHDGMRANLMRPHTGLPETFDAQTGKRRHLCPAEAAAIRSEETVRIMPESYLPLFLAKGEAITVTKNGIRLNGGTYGRFDQDLQTLRGTTVTVYHEPIAPVVVYIQELGKTVDLYIPPRAGSEGDLIHQKRTIEATARNRFEARVEQAREQGSNAFLDSVQVTAAADPRRPVEHAEAPALAKRAAAMTAAADRHATAAKQSANRFDLDKSPPTAAKKTGGLINRATGLRREINALGHGTNIQDDPIDQLI